MFFILGDFRDSNCNDGKFRKINVRQKIITNDKFDFLTFILPLIFARHSQEYRNGGPLQAIYAKEFRAIIIIIYHRIPLFLPRPNC